MAPLASKWTNLALALVAIGGLVVATVPVGGTGAEEAATGTTTEGATAAGSPAARLAAGGGARTRGDAPAPTAVDPLVDALVRSAAVQGVSSRKPPLQSLRGGGPGASNTWFTAAGTHVFTLGGDQTVRLWDAQTLEMEKPYALRNGAEVLASASANTPWVLCVPACWRETWEPGGLALDVLDALSGDLLFETILPEGFDPLDARRLPDGTLLLVADDGMHLCRFDCARGTIVSTITTTARIWPQSGELSKDRLSLRIPPGLGKGTFRAGFTRIDLRTGEVVERKAPDDSWVPASACGFVPGERYLFSAGEELILYAEDTLKPIARRPFASRWPMLEWSGDGHRYALRVEREALSETVRSRIPPPAVAVVSVHETLTGAPIFAVPLTTEPAHLLLAADGSGLIVVGEDGRLTRWTLPGDAK